MWGGGEGGTSLLRKEVHHFKTRDSSQGWALLPWNQVTASLGLKSSHTPEGVPSCSVVFLPTSRKDLDPRVMCEAVLFHTLFT